MSNLAKTPNTNRHTCNFCGNYSNSERKCSIRINFSSQRCILFHNTHRNKYFSIHSFGFSTYENLS